MLRHLCCLFVLCSVILAISSAARAAPDGTTSAARAAPDGAAGAANTSQTPSAFSGLTVQFYVENDLFYKTDRYYTSAVQVRLISPSLRTLLENELLPEGVSRLLGDVPFPGSKDAVQYNISLGFGQQIYTAKDTHAYDPSPDDHPYAGYLYGLLALHAKKRDRLDTLELAAGVIGPSALGEQAQDEVHRARDLETYNGWDHQLSDEPAVMLTWMRTWRLNARSDPSGWAWDVLPYMGASLGIPFTQAMLGGEMRFGWNLPADYGSSTIRPGSGIIAPTEDPDAPPPSRTTFWDNVSLYFFVGGGGRAVAHNTFLDGNTWKDSCSVDKYPLVGELSGGVALSLYDFRVTYTHVYRSKEFHGQKSGQNFGAITLSYMF